jgi:hypothetical protein
MTALSKLALVRASEPTRTRYATLSSEIRLARFGLAQHLVCAWTLDEAGKLRCEWAEKVVPHRPLAARLVSEEARTPEPIPVNGKAAGVHDPDFG